MRLWLFAFLFFLGNTASPQVTGEKIQAQMRQAKVEAQQQIKEMEDDIAEAKKSGENPETIAEMEKNLAMMKKMLGVIDKAATGRKPEPKNIEAVNSVAPYKSPYVKFYKPPVVIPTEAQAKDKLLWYRGKKINQNTLVTTRGRVIQWDKQNNRVLYQYNEKKDTQMTKLIANLSKARQWTNEYINRKSAEKNSFFDYPVVMLTLQELDLIQRIYDKIADNTLELPGTGMNPRAEIYYNTVQSNSGPSIDLSGDSTDPYIQNMYEDIMSRVNNPPPLDVYPPPKQDFSLCYYCDSLALQQFERDLEIWRNGFDEYEVGIISRCLTIYRYYALLMGDEYEQVMDPSMLDNLKKAEAFAHDRMDKKVKMLQQRYGDDIYRTIAVISTTLGAERQRQLLGVATDEASYEFLQFRLFDTYMQQRIAALDYDVMFNTSMILGFMRQAQLLGLPDDIPLYNLVDETLAKNRFALTLDIDFELHMGDDKPAIIATGTMTTRQKIYLKLGRTNDCKWQFYRFDANYDLYGMSHEYVYYIPLLVTGGVKKVRQGEDYVSYSYSGPTDVLMPFPSFRISFCNISQMDSAYMEILRYEAENLPPCDPKEEYCLDMLGYANKLVVSQFNTYSNRTEVTNILDEMTNLSTSQIRVDPTGYAKLDKMQANFKANNKQQEFHQRTKETSKMENTVILFDAQNGSPFLINATHNAPNRELGQTMKRGIIKLKVVLEPL